MLDTILSDMTTSVRTQERSAAAVWLLCLTSAVGKSVPVFAPRLNSLQSAFLRMFSEKSQFTQECAAKGLAVVYDISPAVQRTSLVNSLLDAFDMGKTSASRLAASSSAAATAAGPASLALTAAGDNAYKELCAMATEVGQPELVYKFLALAAHHATWHTRGGVSFGLEALLQSNARETLAPYMTKLLPRLYRYQYDPNERAREGMTRLWMAAVPDPRAAVAEHIHVILTECIAASQGDQWREREAACLALNDALHGREAADVAPHMVPLWKAAVRAIDDVKESVRIAGIMLLKTLGKLTVRLCDATAGASKDGARAVLAAALPFLLNEGITSSIADAQGACIDVVKQIVNVAGALLRPYLTMLVPTALTAMSSFETSALATLQMHADAGTGH
ncbi:MAG: hypothetical protein EOO41_04630, partial [Methanobacteriota archaeon]